MTANCDEMDKTIMIETGIDVAKYSELVKFRQDVMKSETNLGESNLEMIRGAFVLQLLVHKCLGSQDIH